MTTQEVIDFLNRHRRPDAPPVGIGSSWVPASVAYGDALHSTLLLLGFKRNPFAESEKHGVIHLQLMDRRGICIFISSKLGPSFYANPIISQLSNHGSNG